MLLLELATRALKLQDWTITDWTMTDGLSPLQLSIVGLYATEAYSHPWAPIGIVPGTGRG